MSFIGVAIGGSVLNAGLGYFGATNAADKQAQSAQNSLDFQKQVFDTSQTNLNQAKTNFAPWMNVGAGATYTLGQLTGSGSGGTTNQMPDYSSFFNSPDYNFAQSQGQKGVINGANAQGVGLSGGTLKDLATFNSGLASQQYGNYFNRLMGLSNNGLSAASGLGNLATGQANNATNAAAGIGNTTQAVGTAQASGIVGGTNAITGSVNSGISNSLLASYLGKSPSAYGGGSTSTGGALTGYDANGMKFGA